MQFVKTKYEKPRKVTYDVFLEEKKLKPKIQYELGETIEIKLVEQNIVLSNMWWILIFIEIVLGILGGAPGDWRSVKSKRRVITLRLKQNFQESIDILISDNGDIQKINGADSFEVLSSIEEDCPLVEKRVRRYKTGLIIGCISVLAIIGIALSLTFILK